MRYQTLTTASSGREDALAVAADATGATYGVAVERKF
jgi:hypothetical protein